MRTQLVPADCCAAAQGKTIGCGDADWVKIGVKGLMAEWEEPLPLSVAMSRGELRCCVCARNAHAALSRSAIAFWMSSFFVISRRLWLAVISCSAPLHKLGK